MGVEVGSSANHGRAGGHPSYNERVAQERQPLLRTTRARQSLACCVHDPVVAGGGCATAGAVFYGCRSCCAAGRLAGYRYTLPLVAPSVAAAARAGCRPCRGRIAVERNFLVAALERERSAAVRRTLVGFVGSRADDVPDERAVKLLQHIVATDRDAETVALAKDQLTIIDARRSGKPLSPSALVPTATVINPAPEQVVVSNRFLRFVVLGDFGTCEKMLGDRCVEGAGIRRAVSLAPCDACTRTTMARVDSTSELRSATTSTRAAFVA